MLCLNNSQASPQRVTERKNRPSTHTHKKVFLIFKDSPWERVYLCVKDSLCCKKKLPLPFSHTSPDPASWGFSRTSSGRRLTTHKSGRTGEACTQWWAGRPGRAHFCPNIVFPQSARRHFVNGLFDGFIFTQRIYG